MLVFSSLERGECPVKGSSARVAGDESVEETYLRRAQCSSISHLRLAEEVDWLSRTSRGVFASVTKWLFV